MKIAVTLDATCDLSKEIIDEFGFKTIPLGIFLGDNFYLDNQITAEEIFKFADENKTLPKTSAINTDSYAEFFGEVKKEYDGIIHFIISSEMSSCYSNAVKASESFENVYVIDSRTLSTGIALEALYAKKLVDQGLEIQDIVEKVKQRIDDLQVSFVIERLDYLYKGGRCSAVALLGANLLKIRPEISVKDGVMGNSDKYRGKMEAVIEKYCKKILDSYPNADKEVIFITHSPCDQILVDTAKKVVAEYGFKNVYETQAGCTVSSHCGRNTLGILFFGK